MPTDNYYFRKYVFVADEGLKSITDSKVKYYVMYANDTKMEVFNDKLSAIRFAKKVYK